MKNKMYVFVLVCLTVAVTEQVIYFLLDHKDILSMSFVIRSFISFIVVLIVASAIKFLFFSSKK
ncbi:hypothetical protein D0U04_12220 [Bacillus clarus]|uniref:Putative membrane protein n=1 Tax=Bacillus clarus TaxID=2338372 RepID=A0A090YYZ3_9BACI|nr:hypothetical protein [Bacillus clarus]KFN04194.1 putative membrane protein [Bacillus clarus]RFT66670.1 hypothetical protein D0U04_12220 [Bacillus clarus]